MNVLVRIGAVQLFEFFLRNGKNNFADVTDRFQTPKVLKQRNGDVVLPHLLLQTVHCTAFRRLSQHLSCTVYGSSRDDKI